MAVLVVRDITDVHDLIDLIAHLTQALATGDIEDFLDEGTLTLSKTSTPSTAQIEDLVRFDDSLECESNEHRISCSCRSDAAATDPRQGTGTSPPRQSGPVPYGPCSKQGSHEVLTECWMCWSDVHRGAIPLSAAVR